MTDRIAGLRFRTVVGIKTVVLKKLPLCSLYEESLCVPEFSIFHETVDKALDRSVQTFVFGFVPRSCNRNLSQKYRMQKN